MLKKVLFTLATLPQSSGIGMKACREEVLTVSHNIKYLTPRVRGYQDIVNDVHLKLGGYEVIITLDIQYLTLVGGYQETVIFTTDAIPGWGQLVSSQRQTDVNSII